MLLVFEENTLLALVFFVLILLLLANGVHYLSRRTVQPRQFFFISELSGLARHILIGWSVVILLAGVASIFIGRSELLLIVPAALNCYYIVVMSIIYRERAVKDL
jgi:hypothetical protein